MVIYNVWCQENIPRSTLICYLMFGARRSKGVLGVHRPSYPFIPLHRVLSVGTGSPLQTSPNCLFCRMVLVAPRWETEVHFDEVHWILDGRLGIAASQIEDEVHFDSLFTRFFCQESDPEVHFDMLFTVFGGQEVNTLHSPS